MGAGMEAGAARREEPRPGPRKLIIGIFDGELMRESYGDFILPITLPDTLSEPHLLDQFRHQYFRQGDNAVFASLR